MAEVKAMGFESTHNIKLVTKRHLALKSIAHDVLEGDQRGVLIDRMFDIIKAHRGVGLAANQVGILEHIIIIHTPGFKQEFINPVITKRFGGKHSGYEGCLSYPGVRKIVVRDKRIIVEGYDCHWQLIRRKLQGLQAIIVQHEVDHLNGITIDGYNL